MGTEKNPRLAFIHIQKGQPLRLREGTYRQLRDREWIFNRAEDDIVFLIHKSGAYGVVVKAGDIDWNGSTGALP